MAMEDLQEEKMKEEMTQVIVSQEGDLCLVERYCVTGQDLFNIWAKMINLFIVAYLPAKQLPQFSFKDRQADNSTNEFAISKSEKSEDELPGWGDGSVLSEY